MTSQAELFAEMHLRPQVYESPNLVQTRATATRKPNAFTAKSKLDVDETRLLEAVRTNGRFPAIARAFPGVYWSDVFRDLLKARARGLVEATGPDHWTCKTDLSNVGQVPNEDP